MKYWLLYKNFIIRFLVYRARVLIWAVTDIGHFVVFPFIWLAVIAEGSDIAGYTRADMVTYYIIVALVSLTFTSHSSRKVKLDILKGHLTSSLIQPLNHFARHLIEQAAYKVLSLTLGLIAFVVLSLAIPNYLALPGATSVWLFFGLSLLAAFFISHLLEYMLGLASFWFGEVRSLQNLLAIVAMVFSGQLAPLVFFPPLFEKVARWLPFGWLARLPADIYLGRFSSTEVMALLWQAGLWLVALGGMTFVLWRRGLKRYDGVGI